MTFLQPANLFWGGLVALVLLLYLRLFAVQEVEAPALFLWREALARRPAWQRWQRFLSAALQVMILACLVLAAAEPAWVGPERPLRTVAIIVDRSASMRATDTAPTRFDAALAAAKKQLAALGPGDRAMVLSDGAYTDILCPLTGDSSAWAAALDSIQPTDGVGRLSETVALAQARLAGEPNPEILIYTDGSSPDAAAVAKLPHVRLATFGTAEAANLAFTRVAPRVSPAGDRETLVEVANFSGRPETAAVGGEMKIEAGGRTRRILRDAPGQLRLGKADGLEADNQVDFAAPSSEARTILLVGEVHPAIAAAARAIPGAKVEAVAALPSPLPPNAIALWQGPGPARLPPRAIIFEPSEATDGWKSGELIERPLMITQQASPVLGDVALSEVVVEGAWPLELAGTWQVAASAEGGVPILATRTDSTRAVLVNIDLARSDLVQRRELATLVRQAVDWLSARSIDYHPLPTTDSFVPLAAAAPGQKRQANGQNIPEGVAQYGPLDQAAAWDLPAAPPLARPVYAGLLDATESNLAPRLTSTIPDAPAATAAAPAWPLWWIPAGVAVVLLVLNGASISGG